MLRLRAAHCAPNHAARHETAWGLLFGLIGEIYGIQRESLRFEKNENGKPFCVSHPFLHFSIAHASDCAAVVLADFPVGLDCEKMRIVPPRVKTRTLALAADAEDREALVRWCTLESYAKYLGGTVFGLRYTDDIKKAREECAFIPSHALGDSYVMMLCVPRTDAL